MKWEMGKVHKRSMIFWAKGLTKCSYSAIEEGKNEEEAIVEEI